MVLFLVGFGFLLISWLVLVGFWLAGWCAGGAPGSELGGWSRLVFGWVTGALCVGVTFGRGVDCFEVIIPSEPRRRLSMLGALSLIDT